MSTPTSGKADSYDLENSIGYLLNRAAHLIAARFGDELKAYGVDLKNWRILAALSQSDTLSMSEIADHVGAELSYLVRSVVLLEEHGLVERKASATDKRKTLVSLTDAARDLVRELAPKGRAMERLSLANVPAADVKTTLRTLRAICHNLVVDSDAPVAVNRKLTIARRVRKLAQSEPPPGPARRKAA